jgi:hypothetical protein
MTQHQIRLDPDFAPKDAVDSVQAIPAVIQKVILAMFLDCSVGRQVGNLTTKMNFFAHFL